MSRPKIIGVAGPARVGKDVFAKEVGQLFGYEVHRFAGPIKETAKLWFDWTDDHVDGDLKEEVDEFLGFSPRHFMQVCGTEFARNILDEDIWLKIFERKYGSEGVVVSDVRFENEAAWVRSKGGIVVHMRRADYKPSVLDHVSEAGVVKALNDWVTPECASVQEVKQAAVDFFRNNWSDDDT